MYTLKIYFALLPRFRVKAYLAVLLTGISGAMEGLALLTLIPVLEAGMSGPKSRAGVISGWIQNWADVPEQYFLPLGIVVFTLFGLIAALAKMTGEVLMFNLRARVDEAVTLETSQALLEMEWTGFVSLGLGDISKSILSEGAQIGAGVQSFLLSLGSLVAVIVYFCTALIISVEMTLYTILFGVFGGVVFSIGSRRVRRYADHLSGIAAQIGETTGDIFGNLKFFRATGRIGLAAEKSRQVYREFAHANFWSLAYTGILKYFIESGAIVYISIFLMISIFFRQESIASTLVFLMVFYRLTPRLISMQEGFFRARLQHSWHRTWKERLVTARENLVQEHGTRAPVFRNKLVFDSVSFTYPGQEQPVLKNLSLAIEPGICVGVVGSSGAGKSTLIDLVTGILKPGQGTITLDGVDFRDLDINGWRNRIGLVMQDSPLFHTTVQENIAWGDPSPDRDKIIACAKKAQIWDHIASLPLGLETEIGEKGAKLSGGQKQRLAIARALYRDPWLLILDEATNALDVEVEEAVLETITKIKGNCAILMVTHRLKAVQISDVLLVLENQGIAEAGHWQELLKNPGGSFNRMSRTAAE